MRNRRAGFLPRILVKGSCQVFLRRRDLRLSAPDIDQPFGEAPLVRSWAGEKAVREVSAYSTVFPEFAWEGWK
jgi:hypothetical protein